MQSQNKYLRGAICQHVFANGIGNLLVIPVEISDEQRVLIDMHYGLDIEGDFDGYEGFYDSCYSEMLENEITQLTEQGKKYFLKHPNNWVWVARPIRVSDDTVKKYLAINKVVAEV